MALDPKRRAGWLLDLLLQAISSDLGLNLAVTERHFNRWSHVIADLLESTDPAQEPPPPKSQAN